jgi:hypothetical protein
VRALRLVVPLIVVLLGTVLWFPISGAGRWYPVLLNAGHGIVFALVAILCHRALRAIRGMDARAWLVWAFGIAVLLGAVVELLQLPIGRDADLADVGRDALGAWGGLALLAALDGKRSARARAAAALSVAVPLFVLAVPVVESVTAYARRADRFPVLADFSTAGNDYFVRATEAVMQRRALPPAFSRAPGQHALHVEFVGGPYAGVDFFEPVADWTAYREIVFDLTNPSADPLTLTLRVHDAAHDHRYDDRYNTRLVLPPAQRSVVAIPLNEIESGPRDRLLDLTSVADFMLFVSLAETPAALRRELFVSRIWLQ